MSMLLISLVFLGGQLNTLQDKPVVHLPPHSAAIRADFGGDLLELINAPSIVNLPVVPPRVASGDAPWSVDVKNMGPTSVTIVGKPLFKVEIRVGETVHIHGDGSRYSLK